MYLLFPFQRRLYRKPVSQFGVRAWESIWRERLVNHTIRSVEITVSRFCENLCYIEPECVSINLYTRGDGDGNYTCELNNATHEGHEEKSIDREKYSYHAAEVNITFDLRVRLVCFV